MNESSAFEVTAQAGRKGIWTVSLSAEALKIAAVDGDESFQIARADAEEKRSYANPASVTPFSWSAFRKRR